MRYNSKFCANNVRTPWSQEIYSLTLLNLVEKEIVVISRIEISLYEVIKK